MGSTHTAFFSSTPDSTSRISSGWRTFCQSMQAHCRWSSRSTRVHRLLYWRHNRSYSWLDRLWKCIPVGSSNPPCKRNGSPTWQCERTNSLQNNGGKGQVISWGRPFRNKSDSGMAFQLPDAHRFPPESQVHRMKSRNSENDHVKTHHIERPRHHMTNGTCGFRDSMGLPLHQSTLLPSLLHQNSTIHNSQWHMHERFGVNERYSGKNKKWN